MADQNPIYDFIKANGLTDKDEATFLNEYSDAGKAKELYSFFQTNKLTDKDFDTFYGSYLKKKDTNGFQSSGSFGENLLKSFQPSQKVSPILTQQAQEKINTDVKTLEESKPVNKMLKELPTKLDPNDLVGSAVKHVAEYMPMTDVIKPSFSESTNQHFLSAQSQVKKQDEENKLLTEQRQKNTEGKISYSEGRDIISNIENSVGGSTENARKVLIDKTGLNADQLYTDEGDKIIRQKLDLANNLTDKLAYQRLQQSKKAKAAIANPSGNLTDIAFDYNVMNNTDKAKTLLTAKGDAPAKDVLSNKVMGELMFDTFRDGAFEEEVKRNPRLYEEYKQKRDHLLDEYPDFGKKLIGAAISQELEDSGNNNWFLESITKEEFDKAVQSLKDKGAFTDKQVEFANKNLRDTDTGIGGWFKQLVNESDIKTTGLVENTGASFLKGLADIPRGVYEATVRKPIVGSERIAQTDLDKQTDFSVKPKGIIHEISTNGGQFLGQSLSIGVGTGFLKTLDLAKTPQVALGLSGGLQAYANYIPQARQMFPDNELKQRAYASILSYFEYKTEGIFDDTKALKGLVGKIGPEVAEAIKDFSSKKINAEAAREVVQSAVKRGIRDIPGFAKAYAKGVVENTGEETLMQAIQDVTDGAFTGKPVDKWVNGQNLWNTARQSFLGSAFISGLSARTEYATNRGVTAKMIYDMAQNKDHWINAINDAASVDSEIAAQAKDKIDNLNFAATVLDELKDKDLTEKQKVKYLITALDTKVKENTKSDKQDDVLRKEDELKAKEGIKENQKVKEDILSGKDDGEIAGDESDDIYDNRTKEEADQAHVDYMDREQAVRDYAVKNNINLTGDQIDDITGLSENIENIGETINHYLQNKDQYDNQNKSGLPGEERKGQEPQQAQPNESASKEAAGNGGVVQKAQAVEPFITKNQKQTVKVENGKPVVYDKKGNPVPAMVEVVKKKKKDGKLETIKYKQSNPAHTNALNEYAETVNFNSGEKASDKQAPNVSNESEYVQWHVENSSNPSELAQVFIDNNDERNQGDKVNDIQDLSDPRDIVLRYLATGGKINASAVQELFGRTENANKFKNSKGTKEEIQRRIGLFDKNAPGIQDLAHQLWEQYGDKLNISDTDFREAVEDVIINTNSKGAAQKALIDKYDKASDIAAQAATKFEKLTGIPLNAKTAQIATQQLFTKEEQAKAEEVNESELEKMSDSEFDAWVTFNADEQDGENEGIFTNFENTNDESNQEKTSNESDNGTSENAAVSQTREGGKSEVHDNETHATHGSENVQKDTDVSKATQELEEQLKEAFKNKNPLGLDLSINPELSQKLKEAQNNLQRAQRELSNKEDKIVGKQSEQGGLFSAPQAKQSDMFGFGRDESKAILDPLRQKVREAKAELEKVQADIQRELNKDNKQGSLFLKGSGSVSTKISIDEVGIKPTDTIPQVIDKLIAFDGPFTQILKFIKALPDINTVKLSIADAYTKQKFPTRQGQYFMQDIEGNTEEQKKTVELIAPINAYYTFTHEILHWLTLDSDKIRKYGDKAKIERLHNMYTFLKAKKAFKDFTNVTYGMSDFREFMVEMFINPDLREVLNDVIVKNQSEFNEITKSNQSLIEILWDFLTDLYNKIFSSSKEKTPVIKEAVNLATQLFFDGQNVIQDQQSGKVTEMTLNMGSKAALGLEGFSDSTNKILRTINDALKKGVPEDIIKAQLMNNGLSDDVAQNVIENSKRIRQHFGLTNEAPELPKKDFGPLPSEDLGWWGENKEKLKKWTGRYFNINKGLPEFVLPLKGVAGGTRNLDVRRANQLVQNIKNEAKRIKFDDWKAVDDAIHLATQKGSVAFDKLPDELKPMVVQMRAMIDGMGRDLIVNGYVTPEQALTIEANKGDYLTRTYRAYNERNWTKHVPESTKNAAFNFIAQQEYQKLMDLGTMFETDAAKQAAEIANKRVEEILAGIDNVYHPGKTNAMKGKDLGILQKRETIAKEVRDLLGEYDDPGINFVMTVSKLASLKSTAEFLTKVRDLGIGSSFFERDDPNRPAGHSVEIASSGSKVWSPLNGLYTTPEIAEAFKGNEKDKDELVKLWLKIVGGVRWGKTVGSIVTQVKNFESNLGFSIMNGHFRAGKFINAAKFMTDKLGSNMSQDAVIEKVIKLGLVDQNLDARFLKELFQKDDLHAISLSASTAKQGWGKKISNVAGKPIDFLNKLYATSDDFWKVYGFLNEAERISQARFGKKYGELSEKDIEAVDTEASERTKNTYPTYDRVWDGATFLQRKAPVFGNFLSFQAESIRTLVNSFHYAIKDLKSKDMKRSGAERMVGIGTYLSTRYAMLYALSQITGVAAQGMLGFGSDDDEEQKLKDINKYMPLFLTDGEKLPISEGNGRFSVYELTSLEPYNIWFKTVNAERRGGPIEMANEFIGPFIEPEMTIGAGIDILKNQDKYGRKIFNKDEPLGNQTTDVLKYIINTVKPSAVGYVERYIDGDNKKDLANFLGTFGARPYDIDIKRGFSIKMYDAEKRIADVTSDVYKDRNVDRANERLKNIMNELHEYYTAAIRLGVDPAEIQKMVDDRKAVKQTGFDKVFKYGIKTGDYRQQYFEQNLPKLPK